MLILASFTQVEADVVYVSLVQLEFALFDFMVHLFDYAIINSNEFFVSVNFPFYQVRENSEMIFTFKRQFLEE